MFLKKRLLISFSVAVLFLLHNVSQSFATLGEDDIVKYIIHKNGEKTDVAYLITLKRAGATGSELEVTLDGEGTAGTVLPFISDWMDIKSVKNVSLNKESELLKIDIPNKSGKFFTTSVAQKANKQRIERLYVKKGKSRATIEKDVSIVSMESILMSLFSGNSLVNKPLFWVEEQRQKRMIIKKDGKTDLTVPGVGSMKSVTRYVAYQVDQVSGKETPMFSIFVNTSSYPVYVQASSNSWAISLSGVGKDTVLQEDVLPVIDGYVKEEMSDFAQMDYSAQQSFDGTYTVIFKRKKAIPQSYYKDAAVSAFNELLAGPGAAKRIRPSQAGILKEDDSYYALQMLCESGGEFLKTDEKCEKSNYYEDITLDALARKSGLQAPSYLMYDKTFGADENAQNILRVAYSDQKLKNFYYTDKIQKEKSKNLESIVKELAKKKKNSFVKARFIGASQYKPKQDEPLYFTRNYRVAVRCFYSMPFDADSKRIDVAEIFKRNLGLTNYPLVKNAAEYIRFEKNKGYFLKVAKKTLPDRICSIYAAQLPGCSPETASYEEDVSRQIPGRDLIAFFKKKQNINSQVLLRNNKFVYKMLKTSDSGPSVTWEK